MTEIEFIGWEHEDPANLLPVMNYLICFVIAKILDSGSLPINYESLIAEILEKDLWQCEAFLFPSAKNLDRWNCLAKRFATLIAVMSFWPGGVRFFGYWYRSKFV